MIANKGKEGKEDVIHITYHERKKILLLIIF